MNKNAAVILGNACIWGIVMIACSLSLKGTGAFQEIQSILSGGALASLLLLSWLVVKKKKD